MRFGCCLNMVAAESDGTGIEKIEALAKCGFDYVELPLAEMCALSDDDFSAIAARINKSGIACEVCNNFFPKTIRLTGKNVNDAEIDAYVEKALLRANSLGVKNVVFGSGGAKNVPEGFSLSDGYAQVVALLKRVAPVARKNGICIVIEPLRKAECNLINTFGEGCRLARDVDDSAVRVLVDFYHFTVENEPLENILKDGREFLRHVHFARPEGRVYPKTASEAAYRPFVDALKTVGYNARVSCEAYTDRFTEDAKQTLELFNTLFSD